MNYYTAPLVPRGGEAVAAGLPPYLPPDGLGLVVHAD